MLCTVVVVSESSRLPSRDSCISAPAPLQRFREQLFPTLSGLGALVDVATNQEQAPPPSRRTSPPSLAVTESITYISLSTLLHQPIPRPYLSATLCCHRPIPSKLWIHSSPTIPTTRRTPIGCRQDPNPPPPDLSS